MRGEEEEEKEGRGGGRGREGEHRNDRREGPRTEKACALPSAVVTGGCPLLPKVD